MHNLEILPATRQHAEALARTLRQADITEGLRLGVDPATATMASFDSSTAPRVVMVDGGVAAMWGASGSPGAVVGRPWFLTADACEKIHPVRFVRLYCSEVRKLIAQFPRLENYVDAQYTGAVRLISLAGFTLGPAVPYGVTQSPFRRFTMVAA